MAIACLRFVTFCPDEDLSDPDLNSSIVPLIPGAIIRRPDRYRQPVPVDVDLRAAEDLPNQGLNVLPGSTDRRPSLHSSCLLWRGFQDHVSLNSRRSCQDECASRGPYVLTACSIFRPLRILLLILSYVPYG